MWGMIRIPLQPCRGRLPGHTVERKAYPEHFLPTLEQANHLEIAKLAEDLTAIATKRLEQEG